MKGFREFIEQKAREDLLIETKHNKTFMIFEKEIEEYLKDVIGRPIDPRKPTVDHKIAYVISREDMGANREKDRINSILEKGDDR